MLTQDLTAQLKSAKTAVLELLDAEAAAPAAGVLDAAGMPTTLLTLDFETYYDDTFSLKKMTTPEYVHDPRFHVHGLAVHHPDGRAEFRSDVAVVLGELADAHGDGL